MKSKLITQALLNYRNNGGTLPLVEAYKIIKNMNFAEGGDLPESGLPEKNSTIVDASNNTQGSLLTGMMKARMAIAAQMGNTSAQRMTSVYPNRYEFTGNEQINGENIGVPKGAFGTHFMASMDEYAVPFIQERNNKLQFVSNPKYNDAESMRFESPEDAQYFAEHYKDVAPMMQSFATGGELPEDPPVTNLSNYIRDTSSSNDNTNYKSVPLKKGEPPIIGGTLPTVEIKASNTPRNYRNDPISRREDIKTVPITKNNIHNYPVSVQNEFMKQQVADRPDYEAIKNFENFAATGFGLAPIGIVDDVISSAIGTGTKYLGKYTSKHIPQFKSEIDWGKWNPDTPNYPELINEYNTIEESTKKAGTWMKNPDGSAFQGTPEQFIQQQSSWFKKAFTNTKVINEHGAPRIIYHGTTNAPFEIFDLSKFGQTDWGYYGKGIYKSPNKSVGRSYTRFTGEPMELYTNIEKPYYTKTRELYGRDIPDEYDGVITSINKDFVRDSPSIEIVSKNPTQIKSAIGNIGFFDMTNPNIYKSLLPLVGTGYLGNKVSAPMMQSFGDGGEIPETVKNPYSFPGRYKDKRPTLSTSDAIPRVPNYPTSYIVKKPKSNYFGKPVYDDPVGYGNKMNDLVLKGINEVLDFPQKATVYALSKAVEIGTNPMHLPVNPFGVKASYSTPSEYVNSYYNESNKPLNPLSSFTLDAVADPLNFIPYGQFAKLLKVINKTDNLIDAYDYMNQEVKNRASELKTKLKK